MTDDLQSAADAAEYAEYKRWKTAQQAEVKVTGRPRLYVCKNAHAAEAKDLIRAEGHEHGLCKICNEPAGQYPDNVEWSPSDYVAGVQR